MAETTLLRVAMPDRVGSLARVATRLAQAGIDIVRVEVVSADGTTAIDDLLVRGPDPERVVARVPSEARIVGVRDHGELPDPGLAMAAACARVTGAATSAAARIAVVEGALALADAHRGLLLGDGGDGWLRPLAATVPVEPVPRDAFAAARAAVDDGAATTMSGDREWAPPAVRESMAAGAVAVVPVGDGSRPLVLCVARTDWFPFVAAEMDRLRAFGRVAAGVLRAVDGRAPTAP